jgi:hypothetical protein
MRQIVVVLSATALIAASSQAARADPVGVDQVSALSASSAEAASAASTAQSPSMVVGISGQLVALEVFFSRWTPAAPTEGRASSNIVANGGDVTSTLASHTISPFGIPPGLAQAPVYFDLSSAQLQVIAGRLLAFVQGNPGALGPVDVAPAAVGGGGSVGPAYLPPAAAGSPGLGSIALAQPDPVPEPTTIVLVGSSLLLGAMGRRRLRQRKESGQ